MQSTCCETRVWNLKQLVFVGNKDKSPSSDVVGSFSEGQRLHSKGQDVAFAQNNGLTLLGKGRVPIRGYALRTPQILSDQLLRVALFLVAVEFNHNEFLLTDSSYEVLAHDGQDKVLFCKELTDLVLRASTHICLLELVDNATGHTIDQVDSQG